MEQDDKFTPLPPISPIRPLHLRKQSSQIQITGHNHQYPPEINQTHKAESIPFVFPPRTSSLRYSADSIALGLLCLATPGPPPVSVDPAQFGDLSSMRNHLSSTSAQDAPSIDTSRSTVSSIEALYLSSGSSSAILGDFIPIDAMDVTPDMRNSDSIGRVDRPVNPYEFEPITPYINEARQTTMTEFITRATRENSTPPMPSPRPFHTKNSLSEGNGVYQPHRPSPLAVPFQKPARHMLHRSESSPSIPPLRFQARGDEGRGSEPTEFADEDNTLESPTRRGPDDRDYRSRRYRVEGAPLSFPSRSRHGLAISRSPSPTRSNIRSPGDESSNRSSRGRQQTISPPKPLDDVFETDEIDARRVAAAMSPLVDPIPKRSRSPMKKMFGDHGWLGQSPDELKEVKVRTKKSSLDRRDDSINRQKKPGMMGRLKNKFEEFAEKADINSKRSSTDKRPASSLLAISLGPPEQAQISMELELMLVHTGNSFLMNEFSRGRMAVDTIKKTVDTWKGKGRPGVIEFMYDQATQRELVAANQHTFRFHGQRAGDVIRVNSMLYNWKQVANLMSIRTFCNADTVILKLLFDIEQILELLGASEPIMLRVQQIRARVNELIRKTREKTVGKTNGLQHSTGEGSARDTHSSVGSRPRGLSTEDPYGGLKLVPDSYPEQV
ncbi:uncharacterized protein BP5553_04788 [Venustampulla echinocandica]|uniref:Uncharacterized protein n=1 Tax=Venustampulla echinocandica TaxID=2656787 RepID=A0A370TPA7_9HELO|nr:uncharacterized protein BP5553_04788 [Venustampulla echinocandica]RDL37355.1 hypothetical protein BP5553_04788 [Venustampulla echinocandica]